MQVCLTSPEHQAAMAAFRAKQAAEAKDCRLFRGYCFRRAPWPFPLLPFAGS